LAEAAEGKKEEYDDPLELRGRDASSTSLLHL
jgi:hypothetical protein